MAIIRVVSLNPDCFSFANYMKRIGMFIQQLLIGLPVIGAIHCHFPLCQSLQQTTQGLTITISQFPVDESPSNTLICLPDP
jgi:hypothetical protein